MSDTRYIVERDFPCEHGVVGRNHNIMDGARVAAVCISGTEVTQVSLKEFIEVARSLPGAEVVDSVSFAGVVGPDWEFAAKVPGAWLVIPLPDEAQG